MNKLWRLRLKKNIYEEGQRERKRKLWRIVALVFVFWCFCNPQYIKKAVYPYLFGSPSNMKQEISGQDWFEDINGGEIDFNRNGKIYKLIPKSAYKATGRVGIVDNYDTIWNKFYRGHSQGDYINLVPRDVFIVIGEMARPDIFAMFDFEHEERLGSVICKGVKYKKSFMSYFKDEKEFAQSKENYAKCNPYIKNEELNNYHPIPANENINRGLSTLLPGDVITLEGVLVDVPELGLSTGTRKNQVHENMIISGANPGKCFVLYTTRVTINGIDYQ